MRKFLLPAVALLSLLAGAGIGAAAESNIYANNALNYLVKAQGEMGAAPADKGGHRQRALEYTVRAIHEVWDWRDEK